MMKKGSTTLLVNAALLLVLLFGLIQVFISGHGKFLRLELIGFGILVVLSFIGFSGYHKPWGERVFFFVFLLYLVNLALLWFLKDRLYLILLVLAVVGFVISIPRKTHVVPKVEIVPQEPHSMVYDQAGSKKLEEKKQVRKASAQFSPGKYIASKRGNTFHEPKCEWAGKIAPEHRMWFTGKDEAWEKGYKSHSCISG